MNVMVRINDEIFTPPTSDKILDGVTRDSFINLAKKNGITVHETPVAVKKVIEAIKDGSLKEIWGVGTAVVTTQFRMVGYKGEQYELPVLSKEESFALTLKEELLGIQANRMEDPFGWRQKVEKGFAQQFEK